MKYYIDPQITYKTFKKIQDIFPKGGICPKGVDRVLWKMLRDRHINIFIDTASKDDPVVITVNDIPKKAMILQDPK